ncbi:Uncharacterized protein Rs2_19226 [Raphanus sativus]|nr:Uncharacterized protein Rs2_19226 [Raphanus sativus]
MESHREEAQFGVVVCLIRFAKIGAFRGKLQISNGYDSSQLVFNPNIKETEELKAAYKFNDDSMSIVETSEEGKDIVAQATNGNGQKLESWISVEDKTISELFCCTEVDIEDPELLPDCITDLVGKTYKFGVSIEKGSEIFTVLKVWSVYNTSMVDSQSETMSGKGTLSISGSEVSQLTYSDESSVKMATPSKRSGEEIIEVPDTTSATKLRPVKSIKIEKD